MRTTRYAAGALAVGLIGMAVGTSNGWAEVKADSFSVSDSALSTGVQSGMDGRAVTVMYAETSPDAMPGSATATDVLVGGSSPENVFTGDLSQYSGLRFRVTGDGTAPAFIAVEIRRKFATRTHIWRHTGVEVSETPGEWTVIRIPLDVSQGWDGAIGRRYHSVEEAWEGDLANVDSITLRIARNGHPAQAYSLADFQLVGHGTGAISEPARLSMIEDYFGVSSIDDIDRTLDSNGDGMSDYDKLLAGLDPLDPTSRFTTSVELTPAGNAVRWPGVLGGRYAVMRSNDLREGFRVIAGGIMAGFTGDQVFTDQNPLEGVPNFYKVVKY